MQGLSALERAARRAYRQLRARHEPAALVARDIWRHGRTSLPLMRRRHVRFVPILGMHRSGTSCVAGLLSANGLYLGDDLYRGNRHNPKGFWESAGVVQINEALLRHYGGHYLAPPAYVSRFPRRLYRRAATFLQQQSVRDVVGWKDPRTTLTLPAWHELLDKHEYVPLVCFRHPHDVARSLLAIYGTMTYDEALNTWLQYNRRLLALSNDAIWINFDAALPGQIQAACARVGLKFHDESLQHFDEQLVHNRGGPPGRLTGELRCVYACLLERWRNQPGCNHVSEGSPCSTIGRRRPTATPGG